MSALFSLSIWARSPNDDLDLEAIVGKPAGLHIQSGVAHAWLLGTRKLDGICANMHQQRVETSGLSTYQLQIVPRLWLLTQRRNNRLFQHQTIPDMVEKLLTEWQIEHEMRLDRPSYPRLELRTQYGESDYDFISRLLEEAGISFFFAEEPKKGTVLVLADAPQAGPIREAGPLRFIDQPNEPYTYDHATGLVISHDVRPGKVTLRDFDFRRSPTYKLFGSSEPPKNIEERLEQYHYAPSSFLVEKAVPAHLPGGLPAIPLGGALGSMANAAVADLTSAIPGAAAAKGLADAAVSGSLGAKVGQAAANKVSQVVGGKVQNVVQEQIGKVAGKAGDVVGNLAGDLAGKALGGLAGKAAGLLAGAVGRLFGDDKGAARADEKHGTLRAVVTTESIRTGRKRVQFDTNAIDLAPGTVCSIENHPHRELGPGRKLLITSFMVEGTPGDAWSMSAEGVFADAAYRPSLRTPRPTIQGMQSAIVVGPKGEEIYTDETGRVRVQFHWDREGDYDDNSSCWMRVSHGWAGGGYGMIAIPRVGHEVIVAFLEGDPDQPVVVGRLYNSATRPPYDLPANKTRSTWKSDTTPGSGGFNEIMFEDARGRELVYMQAEKDLEKLVKHDESMAIGHNQSISVGNDRTATIGALDARLVGVEHRTTMVQHGSPGGGAGKEGSPIPPTQIVMVDRRIQFTTGEASITLDGPNITMEAKGRIFIHSTDDDVEILGGPWVKINCGPVKEGESDTYTSHHITGVVRDQDGKPVPGRKVVVKASDGAIQQVETDSAGRYFALVPPGKCQVSMPGSLFGSKGTNLDTMNEEPEEFDDNGPVV
ncbi:MAG: type VI secretion system tip protein VgrG [Polyangiaceae bacterium]|nr:type VI secretion system tip protein VgrG [Polyangiaceae bacterium]